MSQSVYRQSQYTLIVPTVLMSQSVQLVTVHFNFTDSSGVSVCTPTATVHVNLTDSSDVSVYTPTVTVNFKFTIPCTAAGIANI
jgi:uncharacterized protein YcfL